MPHAGSASRQASRWNTELRVAMRVRVVGVLPNPVDLRLDIDCCSGHHHNFTIPEATDKPMEL